MADSDDLVAIGGGGLSARIDPVGAELACLRDAVGRDLLWNGDPAVWSGRAPILFPIIGALAGGVYRLGGKTYPLARHGFARRSRFEVLEAGPSQARLRLRDSDDTRAVYPFAFALEARYAIAGAALEITLEVFNPGEDVLPASVGLHPAFRWPLPYGQARAGHALVFDAAEPAPIRRLTGEGLLSPEPRPSPMIGRRLELADALFEADAVIFENLTSRGLVYGAPAGPALRIEFPDTPWLGVWTKPGAGFICVEPWAGVADPEGFDGDLRSKPGIVLIQPGARHAIRTRIQLSPTIG